MSDELRKRLNEIEALLWLIVALLTSGWGSAVAIALALATLWGWFDAWQRYWAKRRSKLGRRPATQGDPR